MPPALLVLAALVVILLCIALDARRHRQRPDAPIPPDVDRGILHRGAGA